jgi:hypothetical protein
MNYTFIVLGVILVIVLYVLYKTLLAPTSVVSSQTYLGSKPKPIELKTITTAPGINCAYAVWVYANNLSASGDLIFKIPISNGNSDSNIELNLNSSATLNLKIKKSNDNSSTIEITKNFPLQRWEYVVISINQNIVDLYLDGKLIKSINLGQTVKVPAKNSEIVFGTGDIYIAGFKILPDPMDPQTAWNNYLNGSGTTTRSLTNYGLSMTLSKNNNPEKTITLF